MTWGTGTSATGPPSVTTRAAPRPKASPRATRRESAVNPVTAAGGVPITRLSVSASSSTLTGTSRGMSPHVTGARATRQQREAGDRVLVHARAGRRRLLRDAPAAVELDAHAERRQHRQRLAQRPPAHVGHEARVGGLGGGGRASPGGASGEASGDMIGGRAS